MMSLRIRISVVVTAALMVAHLAAQPTIQNKPLVVPGEVVIKYKAGVATATVATTMQTLGITVIQSSDQLSFMVGKFSASRKLDEIMDALRALPNVEYVEPNYKVYALTPQSGAPVVPHDQRFTEQWSLHQSSDHDIDAPEAWMTTIGEDSVIVGIIDTGIDYNHQDLKDNIWINPGESGDRAANGQDDDANGYTDDWRGWNFVANDNNPFDDNDHGTHVAGIVGAVGNNNDGIVGVNWRVKLMALKFLARDGSGDTANAANAIVYAVNHGARILNNSWGGGGESQALKDAIQYAHDRGVLFVTAAGNAGINTDSSPVYPACYAVSNIISVASSDRNDKLAGYSNYGRYTVDLAAPGSSILSAQPQNRYQSLSGTSMAAPHVAGACALVWAKYPSATASQVLIRVLGSVDRQQEFFRRVVAGGRLNVARALSTNPIIAKTTDWNNTPNTIGPYRIETSAADEDSLTSINLVYSINGAVADSLIMQALGNDAYAAEIPGKALGTKIDYRVRARDHHGNQTSSPLYSFTITSKPPSTEACCGRPAVALDGLDSGTQFVLELPLNFVFFVLPIMLLRRNKH